jgi:hypothetical protein
LVTRKVVDVLGGRVESRADHEIEAVIATAEFDILLASSQAVNIEWHRDSLAPPCPGRSTAGRVCRCPVRLSDRRLACRRGDGCEPHARLCFLLRSALDVGAFSFRSGNWSFVEDAMEAQRVLSRDEDRALGRMKLERMTYQLGSQRASYTRPRLVIRNK